MGDGDVEVKTDSSLSVHSSPSELNQLFLEENGLPAESMEVDESFPLMEAVEENISSSSSESSENSEAEVSGSCFVVCKIVYVYCAMGQMNDYCIGLTVWVHPILFNTST